MTKLADLANISEDDLERLFEFARTHDSCLAVANEGQYLEQRELATVVVKQWETLNNFRETAEMCDLVLEDLSADRKQQKVTKSVDAQKKPVEAPTDGDELQSKLGQLGLVDIPMKNLEPALRIELASIINSDVHDRIANATKDADTFRKQLPIMRAEFTALKASCDFVNVEPLTTVINSLYGCLELVQVSSPDEIVADFHTAFVEGTTIVNSLVNEIASSGSVENYWQDSAAKEKIVDTLQRLSSVQVKIMESRG